MNRVFVATIAVSGAALAGCQSTTPGTQQAALQVDLNRLRSERDAGRISYSEWAERTGAAARANVVLPPEQERAINDRSQLARRVDAGEISPAQFEAESASMLRQLKARAG